MDGLRLAASLAAAIFLAACSGGDGSVGRTTPVRRQNPPAAVIPLPGQPTTAALFRPSQGILPYPTDLYFAGSTDGTLNFQPDNALQPSQAAVNALDGFSTTAVIRARFSGPLNPASFTPE